MDNNLKFEIYQIGKSLGLEENQINLIMESKTPEKIILSFGPSWYPGGRYGTISIYDF